MKHDMIKLFLHNSNFDNLKKELKRDEKELSTALFGMIFKMYETWLAEEYENLEGGFEVNEYLNNPLETLSMYLKKNEKNEEDVTFILEYIEEENENISKMLNTILDSESIYNALVQKYCAISAALKSNNSECKRNLLVDIIDGIKFKINTFEMGYKIDQRKKDEASPENYKNTKENYEFTLDSKGISSQNTCNSFFCALICIRRCLNEVK